MTTKNDPKWTKIIVFGRPVWTFTDSLGYKAEIEKSKDNKEFPYVLEIFGRYEGNFRTLQIAKDWVKSVYL
jgi:hypothetical protein